MTIVKHELRQGRVSLLIWTCAIVLLLGINVLLYPEMKSQLDDVNDMFSSMGSFTAAFGMDRLSFGMFKDYYALECGSVLGLGGGIFASLLAAGMLSKEEKEHTAEFLLAHPVSRKRIISEKLAAVFAEITVMNLIVFAMAIGCTKAIGEEIPWKEAGLIHLAYYILQLELAGICFGISAFMRRGSVGVGLGLAITLYFLSLIANITESAKPLKYVTPYSYCEGADIVTNGSLDWVKVALGLAICALCVLAAYLKYPRKDIQ